jgi:acetolactate synthase-1/3 small subunit|tara:strand:+ start:2102 stop:2635 length:534 start_codon:yes stop_codon:yes gene_type:complete
MKDLKKTFTVSIYTENNIGLLNRISAIFLKRHINIESLTTSLSEIENIFRFVIVVNTSEFMIKRLIKQIEKQIEVIASFYHTNDQTIFLETALYKVKSKSLFDEKHIQKIIKNSQANIVTVSPNYFVIEKTGWREDTEKLYKELEPYGLLQFVRSGRISVSKEPMNISNILGLNTDK